MSNSTISSWTESPNDREPMMSQQVVPHAKLIGILRDVQSFVAPLWPLKDFVAVNPFVGLVDQRFLAARNLIAQVRDAEMLMPLSYYRQLLSDSEFTRDDFHVAYEHCKREYPQLFDQPSMDEDQLFNGGLSNQEPTSKSERNYRTVAELVDQDHAIGWVNVVANEVARYCAAHFDEGQALWGSPWKDETLFTSWREAMVWDRRMEKMGVVGFRKFVANLPANPVDAIESLLLKLAVPRACWKGYLLGQLFSINGWASYVQYRLRSAEDASPEYNDLIGLLAIRLAYDVALSEKMAVGEKDRLWPDKSEAAFMEVFHELETPLATASRYVFQVALETAYRRKLAGKLVSNQESRVRQPASKVSRFQMIFCIDVRSEVIRRHLESVSDDIETLGFAGFFGLPIEYVPLGSTNGTSQCPVLITPTVCVHERIRSKDNEIRDAAYTSQRFGTARNRVWRLFQTSAISCFTFVESAGLLYICELIKNTWKRSKSAYDKQYDYLDASQRSLLGPHISATGEFGVGLTQRIDMAAGILKNLGLTKNFAEIVAIVGHASETVNNPYQAGLDCGACGGHSGKPNARIAAMLLNDSSVRNGLYERGIDIPSTTWFLPAVHNTTADEIKFYDTELMPRKLDMALEELEQFISKAASSVRIERAERLGGVSESSLMQRARDWSEVRPEWGLAGNAAFIVAPRARTKGLKLDGRTFMHSYEYRQDQDLKVLELIMTAPMVVANWINMQYFASSVDNQAFGSGNKVLHNVVGLFGIQQGNGGDLMTGLPWQSVHDGEKLQHQPLRLSVVIEAPRRSIQAIIDRHKIVQDLAGNGWLTLVSLEDEQVYEYSAMVGWTPLGFVA